MATKTSPQTFNDSWTDVILSFGIDFPVTGIKNTHDHFEK